VGDAPSDSPSKLTTRVAFACTSSSPGLRPHNFISCPILADGNNFVRASAS
jgi:hypothetical protein